MGVASAAVKRSKPDETTRRVDRARGRGGGPRWNRL